MQVFAEKSGHVANVDLVRLTALAAIVLGHVYTHNEFADRVIQSWRLPIFFVLSGYFWSATRSLREETQTRALRLLVPYAWWLLALAVISLPIRAMKEPETLAPAVAGVALGGSYAERPFTTFWFFTALFVATVLYRLLTGFPAWMRLTVVGAGLISNMIFGSELALAPYSVLSALGALIFLEVGRALRVLVQLFNSRNLAALAAIFLSVAVVALLVVEDFVPLDIKAGQFPPQAVAVAVLICSGLMLAAVSTPRPSEKTARLLGTLTRPTLAVILLHPLVLWVLQPESSGLPLPAIASAAFFLPLLGGMLIARTKLAYPLLGVPPADKT